VPTNDEHAPLQQAPDTGGLNQHWQLIPVDGGFFKVRSLSSGLILDVRGASHDDHAMIQQLRDLGGQNQQWQFVAVQVPPPDLPFPVLPGGGLFFKIRSRLSGKVMDVPGRSADPGIKIQQSSDSGGNNQIWQLISVGEITAQHAFARNADDELIHYYWSPQPGWAAENLTQYNNIGVAYRIASDPEAINLQAGNIPTQHVFAHNADSELIHYYWSPQPGWAAENLTQYQRIGAAYRIVSDPKVISLQAGNIPAAQHVFARNANGELIHYYWSPELGWAAENLTQYQRTGAAYQIAGYPEVINLQVGALLMQHVFARNANGELIHYYWSPQLGWAAENLTQYQRIGAANRFVSDPKVINLVLGQLEQEFQ
jgi:hypothetical protein